MRKIYKLLILWLLLSSFQTSFAQTKTQTVEAEGTWQIANITPEKARMLAMRRAKDNALAEAGIETYISSSTYTVSNLVENFMHFSNSETIGEFLKIETLEDKVMLINDIPFYKVRIRAKVKIDKAATHDPEFGAHIGGMSTTYTVGDHLQFTIKTTKDCYVQIFWFNDAGNGGILYPSVYDTMQLLKSKTEYKFPQSADYELFKETKEDAESNNFVFVFTKKEIAYLKAEKDGATTLDDLYDWIVKIPTDQRLIKQESIFIGKKGK